MGARLKAARWLWAGLAALLALAASDGWRLGRAAALNRAIADGSIAAAKGELPAEARFAQAWLAAATGETDEALGRYQALAQASGPLALAARYNAANLLLRRAQAERAAGAELRAAPLAELAKEGYRQVLRAEPGQWDAKYNLELALRLAPEGEEAAAEATPPPARERAPTTMRAFTLGLP